MSFNNNNQTDNPFKVVWKDGTYTFFYKAVSFQYDGNIIELLDKKNNILYLLNCDEIKYMIVDEEVIGTEKTF